MDMKAITSQGPILHVHPRTKLLKPSLIFTPLYLRVCLSAFLFVTTGLTQTIAVQVLLYSGGNDRTTLLVALPQYLGNSLVYFIGKPIFSVFDRIAPYQQVSNAENAKFLSSTSTTITAPSSRSSFEKLPFYKAMFHPERRKCFILTLNEICGFLAGLVGLSLAGSGIYQVTMSGAVVFTAILARLFLNKKPKPVQWISILAISLGLAATTIDIRRVIADTWLGPTVSLHPSYDSGHQSNNSDPAYEILENATGTHRSLMALVPENIADATPMTTLNSDDVNDGQMSMSASHDRLVELHTKLSAPKPSQSVFTGVTLTLVSCLFFSFNYVITEHFLNPDASTDNDLPDISGLDLSLFTGFSVFCVALCHVLVHTVPHWQTLVIDSIEEHHGSVRTIVLCHVLHLTASFLHAVTFFDIVGQVGAVPIGILNAVRAVSVFGVSSVLFCSEQASQCFTFQKGIATILVLFGSLGYSLSSISSQTSQPKFKEIGQENQLRLDPEPTDPSFSSIQDQGSLRSAALKLRRKLDDN